MSPGGRSGVCALSSPLGFAGRHAPRKKCDLNLHTHRDRQFDCDGGEWEGSGKT
jgi:hypothetical protein